MRSSVALLLCGFGALGAAAVRAAPQTVPSTSLGQTSERVALDGDLDTPAWRGAPSITLVQQNPSPGKPTPFTTTVRLLRDDGHLYLGIRCADPQPAKIAVHTLQRDGDQSNDDGVTVVLDTFAQKKLAYVFQVNAQGGRADGVISPGYVNPNTGSAVDYSWNGYWRAVVRHDAGGWTAQIEIDVRSLQFGSGQAAWGLNVSRSLTPDLTLQSLVQYDSVSGAVSANTLLEWIIRPNRSLHVVWNHGLTLNPNLLQGRQTLAGTSVVIKLDWGFY